MLRFGKERESVHGMRIGVWQGSYAANETRIKGRAGGG